MEIYVRDRLGEVYDSEQVMVNGLLFRKAWLVWKSDEPMTIVSQRGHDLKRLPKPEVFCIVRVSPDLELLYPERDVFFLN